MLVLVAIEGIARVHAGIEASEILGANGKAPDGRGDQGGTEKNESKEAQARDPEDRVVLAGGLVRFVRDSNGAGRRE